MHIQFAGGFSSHVNKIFSRLSIVCSYNFLVEKNATFLPENSSREFLKFFHFNREAKSKGLKRNPNLLVKLNFKQKIL